MSKSFLILLVLVLILGVGLGGSFVGGVALGRSQQAESNDSLSPRLGTGDQLRGGGPGVDGPGQGRHGQQGNARNNGEAGGQAAAPPDTTDENARNAAGRPASAPPEGADRGAQVSSPEDSPDGWPGSTDNADAPEPGSRASSPTGDGLTGTIQQLDGGALTVTSPQGEAQVTVAGSTTIHQVVPATGEDLSAGETVRVIGQRGDDGTIEAQSIIIIPEEAANLFSASGRRGAGQRGQRP
jgi:hypothetical protein